MWKLKIEKIGNGFILSHKEEIDDKKFEIIREVIEESDDEKETITRLLERVADFFGFHYDKYEKENLNITWNKKGHRVG